VLERALRGQGELLNESQTARKLLETIFDAMDDAVVITDCDGLITMANHAVADIFNRAPDDLAGQPCGALFAPGFDCRHIPPLLEREVLSVSQERLLNLRVTSFSDAENSIIGYVHVIRDVTRERALERHLMQAERMTLAGMMVSAVAHETATPLSVVANIAEMLLLDCDPRSATADELRKIILAARRVAEMMRNLLGFVRHKAARFEAVDMTQLVGETLELMKYELSRARIEVSVVCAPSLAVWGDRTQLQQVLMNLITNAMQAMRDGGRLTIRLSEDPIAGEGGRMALIVVEDTGHGIPPQAEEKLFDFFFTTKSAEGGTGLGLALTRQIVKGHGGTISAENIRGGARFSVRLPAAVKGAERMRERES
jgi:signal transduction histidine kinase